jgi:hypothetical protein
VLTKRILLAATIAAALSGCASVAFKTTSKNTSAHPVAMAGRKVMVVALNVPRVVRVGVENAMAEEMRSEGIHAVASYQLLETETSAGAAKAKLQAGEYDSALVVRIADSDQDLWATRAQASGDQHSSFWGWGGGWANESPDAFTTQTTVFIEALVYSVKDDQLAWSGLTTMKSANIGSYSREIARMAIIEMKRTGLLV